jgi:CBS domain-containing protein
MKVRDFFTDRVVTVGADATISQAAALMRREHVGDVVVMDPRDERKPLGILTDRDIVVSIVATELDPKVIAVNDAMACELVTVQADDDLSAAIETMSETSVRRLPVVDDEGHLAGVLSMDDVLRVISRHLDRLARLTDAQRFRERSARQ